MALPSSESIERGCLEYGLQLSSTQIDQLLSYLKLLVTWNEKVNLTAIRDPAEMVHRHFFESMFAAEAVPIRKGRLADAGSGGGFPGIPLKIISPELDLILIESNLRKAAFLAEVIRELSLERCRVAVGRYEEMGEELTPLDYACSRALGEFGDFLGWAASTVLVTKQVVLWVGGRDLEEVRKTSIWEWREPIAIPNSLRRYLLVGTRKW